MSFDALGEVKWLAVIVATIAYFVLGAIWYAGPVFGRAWMRAMGWQRPSAERPSPAIFIGPLVGAFVSTLALAALAEATATNTIAEGIVLAIYAGFGIAVAVLFVTAVFEATKPDRWTWFAITAGYHFTGLLIASLVIAASQ